MIGGMAKAYNLTFDYVLYGISYANLTLYGAVIPTYTPREKEKGKEKKVIKADDPSNRDDVRKFFNWD